MPAQNALVAAARDESHAESMRCWIASNRVDRHDRVVARSRSNPVPILDLGTYLRGRTVPEIDGQPAPWDRLLTELRDGGYLAAEADLKQLLEAGGDPVLSQSLPAEAVRRILAAAGHRRYELHNGYLWWWNGPRRPPMSAEDVYVRYGFPVIARVDRSRAHQAPAPGQFGRRILTWAALAGKVLLGIPMGVVFVATQATVSLATVPRLVSKAARAAGPGDRDDKRGAARTPPWQAELARLAHDLRIDEGEVHRTYSGTGDIGELELVAMRDGQRKNVLMSVSHGIFRMGYQVRSRPGLVPVRFSPRTAAFPEVTVTPIPAGELLAGSAKTVREGQVGLSFLVRVPMAAEQPGAPPEAPAATTPAKPARTSRDIEVAAMKSAFAAIPGFAVLAWFAVQTLAPVHGIARLVASIVAATLFVALNFWLWWIMAFGLAMDASPQHTAVPRRVATAFVKYLLILLAAMTMVNAVAGLIAAAVIALIH